MTPNDHPLEKLTARAYDLVFREGHSTESATKVLAEEGATELHAEIAIEAAYIERHEQALRCELTWDSWLFAVGRDIGRSGLAVKLLALASAPVTFLTIRWLASSTTGRAPGCVMVAIGVLFGVIFFAAGSIPIYIWKHTNPEKDP